MNTTTTEILFTEKPKPAPLWRDKDGEQRLSAASSQPSTADITTLNTKKKHSTKRKTTFAAGWVDYDTDAYIEWRKKKEGGTRSKTIAQMLKERAQDDIFERSQKILLPLIQETMRAEFRLFASTFTNRFIAVIARIAYQVSYLLNLFIRFLAIFPGIHPNSLHKIDTESEKEARKHITRRTPQIEEVIAKIKLEIMGQNA
jgi:hypothetical protein